MKEKKTSKKTEKFYEEIVKEVEKDFENRRKERLRLERQWELNMKFLIGDQYCDLGLNYDLIGSNGEFFWQKRDVYNHIAPIVETRIAKFAAISPVLSVRPKSDDDSAVKGADLAEKLLSSVMEKNGVIKTVKRVTEWSETCGTGFYKVLWNDKGCLMNHFQCNRFRFLQHR